MCWTAKHLECRVKDQATEQGLLMTKLDDLFGFANYLVYIFTIKIEKNENMWCIVEYIFLLVVMNFSNTLYMLVLLSKENPTIEDNIYYMSRTEERKFLLSLGFVVEIHIVSKLTF